MKAKRIKLLFVIENSCYGGGEKVFSLLLRNLPKEKYALYCAALPAGRFYEEVKASCRFLPFDLSRRFDLRNIGRLKKLMADNGIDIAHSQGARADFYCALAAAKAGVTAVATVAMPVEGFDVCALTKKIYSALNARAAARTEAAITVSGALAARLRKLYRRVELIPNPVDLAEFNPACFDAGPVIERYGLRGKLVLAALGRLEWQKGYAHLIDALALALAKDPSLKERLVCLIAGTGSLGEKLRRQAAEAGLSGNVTFCGEINDARDFLAAADIFVMPSLAEGQPLALLEAMAMGKPVLASDIPGVSETACDGAEALLVPPGDPARLAEALLRLAGDMPAALAMGRRAMQKAGRYGLPEYLRAHEDFYSSVPLKGGR